MMYLIRRPLAALLGILLSTTLTGSVPHQQGWCDVPGELVAARLEFFYSGVWNDHTDKLYKRDGINITRGVSEEGGRASPGTATFTIDNRGGQFNPRNPRSPLFGLIGRNTPVRISAGLDNGDPLSVRFVGEVVQWPVRWDVSEQDRYVPIEAAGILRRLGIPGSPARSGLHRHITHEDPLIYWPLSEGVLANEARPTIPKGGPVLTGKTDLLFGTTLPAWGAGELAPWLPAGVDFKGGSSARGNVPPMPAGWANTTGWAADFVVNFGTDRGTNLDPEPMLYVAGTGSPSIDWDVEAQPAGQNPSDRLDLIFFEVQDDGSSSASVIATVNRLLWDGKPHHVRFTVVQSGSNIAWTLSLDGEQVASGSVASKTLQRPTNLSLVPQQFDQFARYAFGDLVVWPTASAPADTAAAALGYPGETAGRRTERLCGERDVPFIGVGDLDGCMPMGPQPAKGFLDLLDECAAAEASGSRLPILTETRSALGLTFRARSDFYILS